MEAQKLTPEICKQMALEATMEAAEARYQMKVKDAKAELYKSMGECMQQGWDPCPCLVNTAVFDKSVAGTSIAICNASGCLNCPTCD